MRGMAVAMMDVSSSIRNATRVTEIMTLASLKPVMYSCCSVECRESSLSCTGLEVSCVLSESIRVTGTVSFSMVSVVETQD